MFYIVYKNLGYSVGKTLVAASTAVRELTWHYWNHPTSGVRQLDKRMRQAGVLIISLAAHQPNYQRRQWQPTPVLLPGKSHGWRSLQSMGSLRVGQDWATSLSLFTFMHWRRKWQPTPVSLPGESQGRGSLVGCGLWGHTESGTTEST